MAVGWVISGAIIGAVTRRNGDAREILCFSAAIWPIALPVGIAGLVIWGAVLLGERLGRRLRGAK